MGATPNMSMKQPSEPGLFAITDAHCCDRFWRQLDCQCFMSQLPKLRDWT